MTPAYIVSNGLTNCPVNNIAGRVGRLIKIRRDLQDDYKASQKRHYMR